MKFKLLDGALLRSEVCGLIRFYSEDLPLVLCCTAEDVLS